MKTQSEIKALLESLLTSSTAGDATARYSYKRQHATRFGENAIIQNLAAEKERLTLQVAFGSQHGSASTTDLSDSSLLHLIKRAQDNAEISPEDPEYVPSVPSQNYPGIDGRFYRSVEDYTPEQISRAIAGAIEMAKANNLVAGGLFETAIGVDAIANSNGLFGYDKWSNASYTLTTSGPSGTGDAMAAGHSMADVDVEQVTQQAVQTALAAQNPRAIEPGNYTVIFEPEAVLDLLRFFVWSLDARGADEGSTVFSGKLGERIVSEKLNLITAINSVTLPARAFGNAGIAARPQTWIQQGVLKRLNYDRYWAKEQGVDPDPMIYPLFMSGEERSVGELVAMCPDGVLVKRLWYIRFVDRRECLLTGMTRNGFFRIKSGKVVGAVKNLRFNESPLVFLNNIEAMSRPQKVGLSGEFPAIMSKGFGFSSKSESF